MYDKPENNAYSANTNAFLVGEGKGPGLRNLNCIENSERDISSKEPFISDL